MERNSVKKTANLTIVNAHSFSPPLSNRGLPAPLLNRRTPNISPPPLLNRLAPEYPRRRTGGLQAAPSTPLLAPASPIFRRLHCSIPAPSIIRRLRCAAPPQFKLLIARDIW